MTIILLVLFSGLAFGAEEGSEALSEDIQSILDSLDLSNLQSYLDSNSESFLFNFGSNAKDIIAYLINGNANIEYSSYIGEIFSVLFKNVLKLVPSFAQLVGISLLCAIVNEAEGSVIGKSTAKIVKMTCYAFIVLVLSSMIAGIVTSTTECINNIKKQIEIITPILVTLTVLVGGSSSGAIYQPSALFLSGGAVEIISGFVFPATVAVIIFDILSKLNDRLSFTGISKFIKSILKWVMGITVTIFSIFLTVQSAASSLFDGIFFKATKYVVGNSVPIVGGFLSSGVDLLVSAGSVIKGAVGVAGIILLISQVIQPIIALIAFSLFLKLVAAVVQTIGESAICSLFSDIAIDVDYFIAGLLTVSFMYVLIIMLAITSVYGFV